jgi:hypothetical protein
MRRHLIEDAEEYTYPQAHFCVRAERAVAKTAT